MSIKDRRRIEYLSRVRDGGLSVRTASGLLGLSYRQGKRLWKRYREGGDKAILHKGRGRESNHKVTEEVRDRIVARYRERYMKFGPTLALEKLVAEGFEPISRETLRQWLIEEKIWEPRKRKRKHCERREPKERFGELVQIDGSHHRWFEERSGKCCLMNMVDDATGTSVVVMVEEETSAAALRILWAWVDRYGIPVAVYCDRKNVYLIDREATIDEQLEGREPLTAFGVACQKLGIQIITAYSPQAKGRVERKHGVYQDRLVKELRLEGINTIEEANMLVAGGFVDDLNARFAKAPLCEEDLHCAVDGSIDLRDVFCFEQERKVSRDYVVRDNNRFYQLEARRPSELPRAESKVLVRRWLDGSIHIINGKRRVKYTEFDPKARVRRKAG